MINYQCPTCRRNFDVSQPSSRVFCPYCGTNFTPSYSSPGGSTGQQAQNGGQYGPNAQRYGYAQPDSGYSRPYQSQPFHVGVFDEGPSGKSRGVAGLFALLLGGLGVHYFYCGKVGGGFICILLNLVTCGIWYILVLIQGIMMMCMTQEEFERKYIYTASTFPLF